MASFLSDKIGRRNKGIFKFNKNTKQYIYDPSIYYGFKDTFSKLNSLTYYFEFRYENTIKISKDFLTKHDSRLIELNVSTNYISAFGTEFVDFNIFDENQHTKVVLDIKLDTKLQANFYKIAQVYLEELKKQILKNNFYFTFTDENGNIVTANAILYLRNDDIHKYVYRFDVLYSFNNRDDGDDKIIFKIENAHNDNLSNIIRSGDKVWILNENNQYLSGDFYDNKTSFRTGNITWKKGKTDRLLFEIHAYNNKKMRIQDIINSNLNIQTDYGFKLEILPSTIKGLFDGLSSFVDNYKFESDDNITMKNFEYEDIINNEEDIINKLLVDGKDVLNKESDYSTLFNPYEHYKNDNWINYNNSTFSIDNYVEKNYNMHLNVDDDESILVDKNNLTLENYTIFNENNVIIKQKYKDDIKSFDVDEVFLTFKNDKFSFTFNNDHHDSKKFFNASIINDKEDRDNANDYTSEDSDDEMYYYRTQNETIFEISNNKYRDEEFDGKNLNESFVKIQNTIFE